MKKVLMYALVAAFVCASAAAADDLLDRALAHDAWANEYHFSPHGGVGYAYFEAPESDVVVRYAFSDSTIWTGTYLAAEAFRYAVTGEQEALQNAIRTVLADR